jgi:hypothetical protein
MIREAVARETPIVLSISRVVRPAAAARSTRRRTASEVASATIAPEGEQGAGAEAEAGAEQGGGEQLVAAHLRITFRASWRPHRGQKLRQLVRAPQTRQTHS